jgi:hypothetical protein
VSGASIRPDRAGSPRISVVIRVDTEQRRDDILAAVDSVLGERHPADELIVVVDHNPDLDRRLSAVPRDSVPRDYALDSGRRDSVPRDSVPRDSVPRDSALDSGLRYSVRRSAEQAWR